MPRMAFPLVLLVLGLSVTAQAEKYVLYDAADRPLASDLRLFMSDEKSRVLTMDLTAEEAEELRNENMIVEPVIEYHAMGWVNEQQNGGDKSTLLQAKATAQTNWAEEAMDVARAHGLSDAKGRGVLVCVIDTGVDVTHPLLAGKIALATTTIPGAKPNDIAGHGTFCSSLIVGGTELGSSAPEAKIISVKALDDRGSGQTDWIAKAVETCVDKGANIISMSLGSRYSSEVSKRVITNAINKGVIVVAAAGNDGGAINYPAGYPGVISIGASNASGKMAYFSSRGSGLSFIAPGEWITGARAGGGMTSMSGTSMAAPFVAGMMALKISRRSKGIATRDLGLMKSQQGAGLVDAYRTATNY